VMTTSYPRYEGDPAGNFVGEAVSRLREAGVEMEVDSPASFKHYGIAYGSGVVGNLKREPWRAAMLPAMLRNFRAAARRAATDADLVHAHWLPTGLVAAHVGKPFVVQLWGTDVELARKARPLARHVLRRARLVICPSRALAESARELGAAEVRVIPSGVEVPPHVREEADPPEVLFAGRLSPEKGILELVEAAQGMNLVVAGDGPLRDRVPGALGFVPHHALGPLYERAAVVSVPSQRAGFGGVAPVGPGCEHPRRDLSGTAMSGGQSLGQVPDEAGGRIRALARGARARAQPRAGRDSGRRNRVQPVRVRAALAVSAAAHARGRGRRRARGAATRGGRRREAGALPRTRRERRDRPAPLGRGPRAGRRAAPGRPRGGAPPPPEGLAPRGRRRGRRALALHPSGREPGGDPRSSPRAAAPAEAARRPGVRARV